MRPHEKATKDTAMHVALLRLAGESVLQFCVLHQDGITMRKRWQVHHCPRLRQMSFSPLFLLAALLCTATQLLKIAATQPPILSLDCGLVLHKLSVRQPGARLASPNESSLCTQVATKLRRLMLPRADDYNPGMILWQCHTSRECCRCSFASSSSLLGNLLPFSKVCFVRGCGWLQAVDSHGLAGHRISGHKREQRHQTWLISLTLH